MKVAAAILLMLAAAVHAQDEATYSLSLQPSLGMVSGSPAFVVDLTLAITTPISGLQVDYDIDGMNEVIPNEVVGGPVLEAAGYNIASGATAAIGFSFDLVQISPVANPEFVALSFLFSDPSTVAGQQFCVDEDGDGTVVSAPDATALTLGFASSPCVLLPGVLVSLSATGLTVTISILNVQAIGGSQFFFSGPDGFAITGAENEDLTTAASFSDPAVGPDGALSFSLAGTSVPPQTELGSYISVSFSLPGEYCVVLETLVFSDPFGVSLSVSFVDGIVCFTLEELACPTAGTGDVNFDGSVNIQDVVFVSNAVLGLGDPFDECEFLSADVTSDGTLNVSDVVTLITIVLGTGGR